MNSNQLSYSIVKTIIILILIVICIWFFWEIKTIFSYLAISAILALMGRPLVRIMNKVGIPNTLSSVITLFLILGVVVGLISMFIALVLDQPIQLKNIQNIDDLKNTIESQVIYLTDSLSDLKLSFLGDYIKDWVHDFSPENLTGIFGDSINLLASLFMDAFSVCFITFFFLKDKGLLNHMILAIVPDKDESRFTAVMDTVKNLLSRYFIGLFLQALIMFVFYFVILWIFGIDNKAVIALICALLNLIPYLGPLIGGITIGLLSLSDLYAQNGFELNPDLTNHLIWIIALYLIAQLWDNFINQPLIYSQSVKSNPLEIFLVILIGGTLFGVIGVIVAIPFYTVLRVFLKEFYSGFKLVKSITKNI